MKLTLKEKQTQEFEKWWNIRWKPVSENGMLMIQQAFKDIALESWIESQKYNILS